MAKIKEGNWDYVVLQENLMLAVLSQDEYLRSAHNLDENIHRAGGQTVLLMLWGSKYDARVTTGEQARVSEEIGSQLGLRVAPLGLAWGRARQQNPELRLYEPGSDDASEQGDYLNTAVLLATLLNRNPMDADYMPRDSEGISLLSEVDAEALRRYAWETVQAFEHRP